MILRYLLMKSTGKKYRQLEEEAKVGQLFSFVFLKLHINLIFMLKMKRNRIVFFYADQPLSLFWIFNICFTPNRDKSIVSLPHWFISTNPMTIVF